MQEQEDAQAHAARTMPTLGAPGFARLSNGARHEALRSFCLTRTRAAAPDLYLKQRRPTLAAHTTIPKSILVTTPPSSTCHQRPGRAPGFQRPMCTCDRRRRGLSVSLAQQRVGLADWQSAHWMPFSLS